jgi:D-tyrosyl-tRNA(Tyr) deacylase
MRAVVQRVCQASVDVNGKTVAAIRRGLLVLVGVGRGDTEEDARYLAEKIVHLRIFPDEDDKLNRSVVDIGGAVLAVSQFTLWGDCRKGRRPSFVDAAPPDQARHLYEAFLQALRDHAVPVESGVFQETMAVHLTNDGPVTILLDSRKAF